MRGETLLTTAKLHLSLHLPVREQPQNVSGAEYT